MFGENLNEPFADEADLGPVTLGPTARVVRRFKLRDPGQNPPIDYVEFVNGQGTLVGLDGKRTKTIYTVGDYTDSPSFIEIV